jgi:hypothetical protein
VRPPTPCQGLPVSYRFSPPGGFPVRKRTIITTAAAFAAVAAAMPANAVTAKAPTVSDPIAENLAGPLQMSVNTHGIAVAQSFSKTVSKVRRDGTVRDLVTERGNANRGADVSGVLLTKKGVVYTYTNAPKGLAKLKFVSNGGDVRPIADLGAYEGANNPDAGNSYGFRNLDPDCKAQVPEQIPGQGDPYGGIVESHPYAIAKAPRGYYVADAAGNDILWVSRSGRVETVAVLKPQGTRITEEDAQANGLPECTIGKRYVSEPVPTDVEVMDNGKLVVSLLPGAPEGAPRGKVVRIDPATGMQRDLGTGFLGATNVAVGGNAVYVTNLFGDAISKLRVGGTDDYASLPSPAALEWYKGKLYVGYDVFGPSGKIATIG